MTPRLSTLFGIGLFVLFASLGSTSGGADSVQHVTVYHEPGRFGGWPANHGIWSWGDEILVGFSRGSYRDLGPERHHIDREAPEEHLLARSLDGGTTWSIKDPSQDGDLIPEGKALHGVTPPRLTVVPATDCPGGIDFTHPDFAMTLRMSDADTGPSRFYYSYDRGHDWEGPFKLPLFGQLGVMARTAYLVEGKHECLAFLTAAKTNNEEGRPFCARTEDGGKSWDFVSWIGPEPEGFSIMPSAVRLSGTDLLCAVRRREEDRRWNDAYLSRDNGRTWEFLSEPTSDLGVGNPPCLIELRDGRICYTYGYRATPFKIGARLSSDGGKTWGEEIALRTDGGGRDIGYVRTVERPDGKVVTVYYWCDDALAERYIAATIWTPPLP